MDLHDLVADIALTTAPAGYVLLSGTRPDRAPGARDVVEVEVDGLVRLSN